MSKHDGKKKAKHEETAPETAASREKMRRKAYERELGELQIELSALQAWIKRTGERVVIVFEGRDAAGKGGTIRAITERLSPRVCQVVALPAPSDREKTQLYMQRYLHHFPAAGEVVIFDRSWYNRAGVEIVMGFCTEDERDHFLVATPWFGRVEVWRGDRRPSLSVSAPFVRRCLTNRTLAPFPHPARRTRRADFPQRALFQNIKPSHSNGRRATAPGVSAPVFRTGTGRSIGGTPFPVCRAFASTRSVDVAPHSCRYGDRPSPPVLG